MTRTLRPTYGYARTRDGQVHYQEMGDGPPLLLISESPRTHRQFRRLAPLLAQHFRTIAIDTPGYGNSDPLAQGVTIPNIASAIIEAMDALELESVHLFGVHTGNKVGAMLAASWPQRFARVVLAGYPHSIIPDQRTRNSAIQPIFDRFNPRYAAHDDGAHLVRNWATAQATLGGICWPPQILVGESVSTDGIEDANAHAIDYLLGWRNAVAIYQAVFDFDLAAAISRIKVPALVLEFSVPQERHLGPQAQAVAALMPQGQAIAVDTGYPLALQDSAPEIARSCLPFLLSV